MPRAHLAQHRWGLSQAPSEPCTPHVEIILRYQSSLQTAKTKLRSILLVPERHPRTKVRSRRYPAERAAPSLATFSFHPPRAPGSTPPCRGLMHTPEDTLASVCPLPLTPCSLATLLPWTRVDTPTAQSVRGSGKRPAQAVCGLVTTCAGDSRILLSVVQRLGGGGQSANSRGHSPLARPLILVRRTGQGPPGHGLGAVQPLSPSTLSQEGTPCSSRLWFILALWSVHCQKCISARTSESIHTIISIAGHISIHLINFELAQMQAVGEEKRKQAKQIKTCLAMNQLGDLFFIKKKSGIGDTEWTEKSGGLQAIELPSGPAAWRCRTKN